MQYFIGLMSGTSLDGVDLALFDFDKNKLIGTKYVAYKPKLRQKIQQLTANIILKNIVDVEIELSNLYVQIVNDFLCENKIDKSTISAIGCHGQTIYHCGGVYSWQLAKADIIAQKTGIKTVVDFRSSDIASGGEGAPLTPKYHQYLLNGDGIVVNLGGIANITLIKNNRVTGFDSGPANTLMDNYIFRKQSLAYDNNGVFAKTGVVLDELLKKLLQDDYFAKKPPKSTGVEYFNLQWLDKFIKTENPNDIMRTLLELSAITISKFLVNGKVYFCGGGTKNQFLMQRIKQLNFDCQILTTDSLGVDVDFVEAVAFAYFAKLRLENKTANITDVTGANKEVVLGTIYG